MPSIISISMVLYLSMVFGEGAGEIFNFDALLYLKEAGLFAIVAAIVVGVWYLSHRVWLLRKKAYAWLVAGIFVGCTLYAHLWHIYAAFYQHQSVMKSATLLPYYFPTTSNGLLLNGAANSQEEWGRPMVDRVQTCSIPCISLRRWNPILCPILWLSC